MSTLTYYNVPTSPTRDELNESLAFEGELVILCIKNATKRLEKQMKRNGLNRGRTVRKVKTMLKDIQKSMDSFSTNNTEIGRLCEFYYYEVNEMLKPMSNNPYYLESKSIVHQNKSNLSILIPLLQEWVKSYERAYKIYRQRNYDDNNRPIIPRTLITSYPA